MPKELWLFQNRAKSRVIRRKRGGSEETNVSLSHTRQFHSKKHFINKTILGTIGQHEVIYGERGLSMRFPRYLQRPTQDYDIYSPNPRKDAHQTEKKLDQRFRGDYFFVKPALHSDTFRVTARANQETYADYTKKPKHLKHDTIKGKNIIDITIERKAREKILRNPEYEWRWGKDRDALNRIKIYEKYRR